MMDYEVGIPIGIPTKKINLILTPQINILLSEFKLPRPTNSTKKDVLGRLFLCLKSGDLNFSATDLRKRALNLCGFGIAAPGSSRCGTAFNCSDHRYYRIGIRITKRTV